MKRVLMVLTLLLLLTGAASADAVVQINNLVEQAARFDRQTVTVEGEVVGDVMLRGEYGWVNISDGTNDLGVWAPAPLLSAIGHAGRYHTKGDTVRVTGEFRRADTEHGGDLDLRATSLEVLQPGEAVARPIPPGRGLLAAVSVAVAAGLGLLLRVRIQKAKG